VISLVILRLGDNRTIGKQPMSKSDNLSQTLKREGDPHGGDEKKSEASVH